MLPPDASTPKTSSETLMLYGLRRERRLRQVFSGITFAENAVKQLPCQLVDRPENRVHLSVLKHKFPEQIILLCANFSKIIRLTKR